MRIIPKYDNYRMIGRVRTDGALALANSNPTLISRGLVEGANVVHKFGRNSGVPNGSWEGVLQAAAQFPWLQTATTVRIAAGGNAADAIAGAGARSVTIEGLNAAGVAVSETVATAGIAASLSTTTAFLRVNRAYVASTGTYTGANTGAVVIENTAGTVTLISIAAGEGQSQFCAYTIPAGKVGHLASLFVQADAAKAADFRLFTRANANDVTAPFEPKRVRFYLDGVLGVETIHPVSPMLTLPALTDIWVEAQGGGAGTEVSADMELLIFDA